MSSLPLRSLPPAVTRAIGHQFETLLDAGGLLVQYTYDLRGTQSGLLPTFGGGPARSSGAICHRLGWRCSSGSESSAPGGALPFRRLLGLNRGQGDGEHDVFHQRAAR